MCNPRICVTDKYAQPVRARRIDGGIRLNVRHHKRRGLGECFFWNESIALPPASAVTMINQSPTATRERVIIPNPMATGTLFIATVYILQQHSQWRLGTTGKQKEPQTWRSTRFVQKRRIRQTRVSEATRRSHIMGFFFGKRDKTHSR